MQIYHRRLGRKENSRPAKISDDLSPPKYNEITLAEHKSPNIMSELYFEETGEKKVSFLQEKLH